MMFPDPVEDDNRGVDRISENRQNGRDKGQVDLDAENNIQDNHHGDIVKQGDIKTVEELLKNDLGEEAPLVQKIEVPAVDVEALNTTDILLIKTRQNGNEFPG